MHALSRRRTSASSRAGIPHLFIIPLCARFDLGIPSCLRVSDRVYPRNAGNDALVLPPDAACALTSDTTHPNTFTLYRLVRERKSSVRSNSLACSMHRMDLRANRSHARVSREVRIPKRAVHPACVRIVRRLPMQAFRWWKAATRLRLTPGSLSGARRDGRTNSNRTALNNPRIQAATMNEEAHYFHVRILCPGRTRLA